MVGYIHRYLEKPILDDLQRKMVFIGGPRQTGKTTLAKRICSDAGEDWKERYLSWDSLKDRKAMMAENFPPSPGILVLDEIHKYTRWRQMVKGLFDKRGDELKIIVTGSARLDYYRRGGDSLQGRYHFYRLFPISLAELGHVSQKALDDLMTYSGFPEPFLSASETATRRWNREYSSRIIQEDLRDLENVIDINLVERLAERLPELVGSPLSINGLREDLEVSHKTVSRWIGILENIYMIFRVYPFGAPKLRAVKKEAKHYHYNWTLVEDKGKRFENLVACHLLKWCTFKQDSEGRKIELSYFRDIDRREVDFVITENGKPIRFIETKCSGREISLSLKYLKAKFPNVEAHQVVLDGNDEFKTNDNIFLSPARKFLAGLI